MSERYNFSITTFRYVLSLITPNIYSIYLQSLWETYADRVCLDGSRSRSSISWNKRYLSQCSLILNYVIFVHLASNGVVIAAEKKHKSILSDEASVSKVFIL